jgi:Tfp pilus assembly protein PilO
MLTKLLDKPADHILGEMLHANFQLKKFLNDKQMRQNYNWIFSMTTLLEKITACKGSRERIVMILEQLPNTPYLEGVYDEVRKTDAVTDQLRFDFIQSFLKISETFLAMIPHSADDLTKIFERIELQFTKVKSESPVRIINLIIFTLIILLLSRNLKKRKHYLVKYSNELMQLILENIRKHNY